MPTQQQRRLLFGQRLWTYLLGPFFKGSTPNQAAPLTSPYTEAGAVGALTVTDTGNRLTTSAGKLNWTGPSAYGDPALIGPGVARVAGRAILATVQRMGGGYALVGWADTATPASFATGVYAAFDNGKASAYSQTKTINDALTTVGVEYQFAVVARSAGGGFVLVRGGTYTTWTLLYPFAGTGGATIYAAAQDFNIAGTLANLRVADLGGAWASDYGIATDRKSTSAATDTISHNANAIIEHTITAATGVTQELWVRRTDASNGWIVRMSQAGSTIKLIELVAGVETERASTAQTWTNGSTYRVVVICDGTTITPYVANVAKTGYASASTNQTATTAYVDTAGADFVSWPRTISLPSGV